jgi:Zn-dependent protease with chaperone function
MRRVPRALSGLGDPVTIPFAEIRGGRGLGDVSTHPSDDTRIKRIEGWMPEALRIYEAQTR